MESATSYGNESMDSEMGYGDEDSADYELELDMEPSGVDGEDMLANSMTRELLESESYSKLEPQEGMEFETEEDAWTFYNSYARCMGFNTRISVYHKSRRDGSITSRQFVCAKEGFRTARANKDTDNEGKVKRLRSITRVGCKAMFRVRKQENGKWVVSKFQKMHNHDLVTPSRAHCLRSHRLLSESAKNLVEPFQGPSVELVGDSLHAFGEESHEFGHFGYVNQDHICYTRTVRQSTIGNETHDILEYFKRMQAEDSAFYYAVQFDEDQCTGNVFWSDAKSRMAYKYFGDVITFDASYKANQYQVPFSFFTGVNHHRQPVLFACALLVDDSETSLLWLFKALLSAMSERHPTAIISDQDRVIQDAVAQVFPNTRHRLCKWHILKECQDKLSHVCRAFPTFQGEFHRCINMVETIHEFESYWEMLIARYNLRDNEWLQSLYSIRNHWVPVYLQNTFFAGMSPSQRCESRSSFFDGYINAQTTPQMFVQQYEKALDSRYEKEIKADFDTIYTIPILKTPSPMEKQAADLYTRKIFVKFQEEFIETFIYTANKTNEEENISTFKVAKFEEQHKAFTVMFDASETKAICNCQMFEYSGILCRHILTVFSVTSVLTLPSHYILKRWTRDAKNDGNIELSSGSLQDKANAEALNNNRESLTWRYNNLCREAIKFAEDGATSIDLYNVAVRALQEAMKKVDALKGRVGKAAQNGISANGTNSGDNHSQVTQADAGDLEKRLQSTQMSLPEPRLKIPTQDLMLFQQPFNFVLLNPMLQTDSSALKESSSAAPLSLSITNSQKQLLPGTVSAGGLDGKGTVLLSMPSESISIRDSKHGEPASQLAQRWSFVGMGPPNCNPTVGSDSTSLTQSDSQVVAVPLAFYVPLMGNLPLPHSDPMNSTTSGNSVMTNEALPLSPLIEDAGARCAIRSSSEAAPKKSKPLKRSSGSTNPIRAAVIATGGHNASPSAVDSMIETVPARNTVDTRSEGGSFAKSQAPDHWTPLMPMQCSTQPTDARHIWTNQFSPLRGETAVSTATKVSLKLDSYSRVIKEPVHAEMALDNSTANDQTVEERGTVQNHTIIDDYNGNNQMAEKRGMKLPDSGGDDDLGEEVVGDLPD